MPRYRPRLEIAALRADRPPTRRANSPRLSKLAEEREKIDAGAPAVRSQEDGSTTATAYRLSPLFASWPQHEHHGPHEELGNARRLLRKIRWRASLPPATRQRRHGRAGLRPETPKGTASEDDERLTTKRTTHTRPAELKQAGWPKGRRARASDPRRHDPRGRARPADDDEEREQIDKRETPTRPLKEKEAQLSQREVTAHDARPRKRTATTPRRSDTITARTRRAGESRRRRDQTTTATNTTDDA